MKKVLLMALIGAGLCLGVASRVEAQHFYVSVAPAPAVIVRPPAPSPRHVWVASEWGWSGGRYVETPGYWVVPPRGHRAWIAGHWARERRGQYWVPGRWR